MKKKPVTIRSLMKNKAKPALTATGTKSTLAGSTAGYRTIPQIFLEDYGIQLNEASGEWWRLEQNPVVNTELLDNLEHDLYYYITAGGSYGSGDVRLPIKDSATGEVIVPEGWTGPFTDVVWWDCDVEGIVHEFRIYCYAREPYHATQKSVFLTRNTSDPALFATEAGSAPAPEPTTAPQQELIPASIPGPAPISEPETEPTADPAPLPAPEPLPVPEPPPPPATPPPPAPTPVLPPPAKTALQEVYETLSPSKLGTVVGLRALLAKEQKISVKEAKNRINSVLKAVSDIAAVSGTSTLYGFGCFKAQNTKARTVKSHLGSYSGTYTIPKTTKFTFKPGKELKAKMSLCTGKTQAQIITALQTLETVKRAKAIVRKATRRGSKAKRAIAPKVAGKKAGR